jgi:DNA invertase Pin-like site-specific DNA recombinase
MTAERAEEIRKRAAAGESKSGLAREFKISQDTLYRYLRIATPRKMTAKPSLKRRGKEL